MDLIFWAQIDQIKTKAAAKWGSGATGGKKSSSEYAGNAMRFAEL